MNGRHNAWSAHFLFLPSAAALDDNRWMDEYFWQFKCDLHSSAYQMIDTAIGRIAAFNVEQLKAPIIVCRMQIRKYILDRYGVTCANRSYSIIISNQLWLFNRFNAIVGTMSMGFWLIRVHFRHATANWWNSMEYNERFLTRKINTRPIRSLMLRRRRRSANLILLCIRMRIWNRPSRQFSNISACASTCTAQPILCSRHREWVFLCVCSLVVRGIRGKYGAATLLLTPYTIMRVLMRIQWRSKKHICLRAIKKFLLRIASALKK